MAMGVRKVLKNGLYPAHVFGSRALGLPNSSLEKLRRSLAKCIATNSRGSTTLSLALNKMEPTMQVTADPIFTWSATIWEGVFDQEVMKQAWRNKITQALRPEPLRATTPTVAVLSALQRAGWSWPAWDQFLTRQGFLLNLRSVCPMDVQQMLFQDVEAVMWEKWTSQDEWRDVHPKPCIKPVISLVNRRCSQTWTEHHRNVAKSTVISGAVTQQ
eukprot:7626669-Karenia_brevis.AAC.1